MVCYRILRNGLKIQWGTISFSSSRTKVDSINLTLTFSSKTSFKVIISAISSSSNSAGISVNKTGTSSFSFIVYGIDPADRFIGIDFIAIGY